MKSVISYFLNPIPIFGILILVGILLWRLKEKKWAGGFFVASALWFLMISTSFVPEVLLNNLEKQYPVFRLDERFGRDDSVHILVLGSGHINDSRLQVHNQLTETSLARITEGIRIQKLFERSLLVTSAAHMQRSVQLFEKRGLQPIPAPTDHLYKHSESKNLFRWIPYAYNIRKMESAMHECIGILWMKLTIR